MAYMKNSDALLEFSLEKTRELGHADDSVDGNRRINPLNRAIAAGVQEQGFGLVLTTELRGQAVLRLCTINPRTTEEGVANQNLSRNGYCAGRVEELETGVLPATVGIWFSGRAEVSFRLA